MNINENKELFISIFKANINREGASELLTWLEKTDFFVAPASTKYHEAYEGGLCEHSLVVYKMLENLNNQLKKPFASESIAVVGLLHDVCKCRMYQKSTRNVKNEQGQWEAKEYYIVENKFPYGHGDKSVFLIERHMRLRTEEAMAINWHMGGFDERVKGGSYDLSPAFEQYPLAALAHLADMQATYLKALM